VDAAARRSDDSQIQFQLLRHQPRSNQRWHNVGGLKRSLVQLLKIVSAFTVGHSLTLLVGALGWVQLPGQAVETLIAASILVSAIHAIRPWFAGHEVFIAAGFLV
jgi:hypothetical protein